jgi:hypothetical protein
MKTWRNPRLIRGNCDTHPLIWSYLLSLKEVIVYNDRQFEKAIDDRLSGEHAKSIGETREDVYRELGLDPKKRQL